MRSNPQSADLQTIVNDAITQQKRGNHKGAIKRFKRILKHAPDHPEILNLYALSLAEHGDVRTAQRALEAAVKYDPDYVEGWGNLGVMLAKGGNNDAAIQAYDRVRKLAPELPAGHVKFADACQHLERYGDALNAYEMALSIDQNNPSVWRGLSRACMFEGEWDKALKAADRALHSYPGHTLLLGIKSVAYSELGHNDEAAHLVDFEKLIEVKDVSVPDGYADLKSFNHALCSHSLAHPSLDYEPTGKSTKKGHQTTNLAEDEDQGPVADLLAAIDDTVRNYQNSHPVDQSHPFLAQRPDRWDTYIWATVLGSQGHQSSHIHPSGWLSGVYYAKIPDVVSANSESQAGWIEFGRAAKYPNAKAEHPVRSYPPHEGMIVLFPSYFYHRTEPFESTDQRISIAFDILPLE